MRRPGEDLSKVYSEREMEVLGRKENANVFRRVKEDSDKELSYLKESFVMKKINIRFR